MYLGGSKINQQHIKTYGPLTKSAWFEDRLKFSEEDDGLHIELPVKPLDDYAYVYKIGFAQAGSTVWNKGTGAEHDGR